MGNSFPQQLEDTLLAEKWWPWWVSRYIDFAWNHAVRVFLGFQGLSEYVSIANFSKGHSGHLRCCTAWEETRCQCDVFCLWCVQQWAHVSPAAWPCNLSEMRIWCISNSTLLAKSLLAEKKALTCQSPYSKGLFFNELSPTNSSGVMHGEWALPKPCWNFMKL